MKTGNCLPERTRYWLPGRSHSLPVKECYLLGKHGNCLPGRYHSGKEHCLLGRTGNCLPGRAHSLLVRVLSTGEAWGLPGRYHSGEEHSLPGRTGNCLPERVHSLLEKECCLPGEFGGYLPGRYQLGEEHYLPERLEGESWELTCLPENC